MNPQTTIEVLIPDFQGKTELLNQVIEAHPDIISHNMETVRRISPLVRSAANYDTSLQVISHISKNGVKSKSGIMVGLGETPEEVETLMDDLLAAGCPDTHHRTISATQSPALSRCRICDPATICKIQDYRLKKRIQYRGECSSCPFLLPC